MWINKATNGIFSFLATKDTGFLAASALTLIVCHHALDNLHDTEYNLSSLYFHGCLSYVSVVFV